MPPRRIRRPAAANLLLLLLLLSLAVPPADALAAAGRSSGPRPDRTPTPPERSGDRCGVGGGGDRRLFLSHILSVPAAFAFVGASPPAAAAARGRDELLSDLEASKARMEPIPGLLKAEQWDSVRTILKTPPVNSLWNLGESQNTLVRLAKETDEFGLLELKDELAISLQMCDQYTYDNAFVYFQPGNGKIKLKEPTELALKAMGQIQEAIDMVR